MYDPFLRGPHSVGVRTIQAYDPARDRLFPCEIWYPAAVQPGGQDLSPEIRDATPLPGTHPLVVYSHPSLGRRRAATFLCTHLSSHGYVVAALDHSELIASDLAAKPDETAEQRTARAEAWAANRVPDLVFLIDRVLHGEILIDPARIGAVGHSFGGWTVLAAPNVEPRIRAVVALAPAGSSHTKPGIIPARLAFHWTRDVPALYLVADEDVCLPLTGMFELFERTPAAKRMFILRRADHLHFMDNVEQQHETVRAMKFPGELAWISEEMRPITELCSGDQAHLFVRGLTLCHMDATLRQKEEAERFLAGDLAGELARRGVGIIVHK